MPQLNANDSTLSSIASFTHGSPVTDQFWHIQDVLVASKHIQYPLPLPVPIWEVLEFSRDAVGNNSRVCPDSILVSGCVREIVINRERSSCPSDPSQVNVGIIAIQSEDVRCTTITLYLNRLTSSSPIQRIDQYSKMQCFRLQFQLKGYYKFH
jgi:hypothetical protein